MQWRFRRQKRFPVFSEVFEGGLVDLHSHVLPGLDDGARDLDESIAMLDGMAALGYTRVVATPHFDTETRWPDVESQRRIIDQISSRRGDKPPAILSGAEAIFDSAFAGEEEKGNVPRLGESRLYVVEFHFNHRSVPAGAEESFFQFKVKGGELILAHPERIPDLQGDVSRVKAIKSAGAFLQVDLLSVAGRYGDAAKRTSLDLIEDGVADLVSSDLHRLEDLEALDAVLDQLARWDSAELERLASTNPAALLDGRPEQVRRNA